MNTSDQVEAVSRVLTFHSGTEYSWFGKRSPRLPRSIHRALTQEMERDYLLFHLQSQLYRDFYCVGAPTPARQESPVLHGPLVQQLSAANTGHGLIEEGWQVHAITGATIVIRKSALELWVRPEDCVFNGSPLAPGMQIGLKFPKELPSTSPGFYTALSDHHLAAYGPENLVRFYWNLTPEGAVRFLRRTTRAMNDAKLPFTIKALNDPARFRRCDAVVLYIRKADYEPTRAILETIYPDIAAHLKKGQPAFTKVLAPGVALAEDPGRGDSFGMHRCGILAEGLIRAHEQRRSRLDTVRACFEEREIDFDRPYLHSSNHDHYEFRSKARGTKKSPTKDSSAEIGQRLVQSAVWHEGRCNWMGQGSALGPDLYSGTSGIALFLSQLSDPAAQKTALGAIEQALSRLDAIPPDARLGLYMGWTGIAFAAACLGLHDRAAKIIPQLMRARHSHSELDFVSGKAGAITAFIHFGEIEFAARLGDALLRSAQKSKSGWSWKSPAPRNLTGFAHGTAGVAHALVELFQATGAPKYRQAAEQAFLYERQWFDAAECNWPDFRETKRPLRFSAAWCHGAPGIALSRLRAYEILRDSTYKAEAITALETTRRLTEQWLESGTADSCLCHGLAGNAEILLHGSDVLGPEQFDGNAVAHRVARAITIQEDSPGLMTGMAGIGCFYLHLHNRSSKPERPLPVSWFSQWPRLKSST
ncbi:MAG: hypothetical protein DMF56_24355 [Acidobacteria bacterium]|nr:MAG: hypothetical protein DMF56_24355 [Acidobacteriota bacterium]